MTDTINDILSGGAFTRQQADALRLLLGTVAGDPAGTADAAVTAHEAAVDPHPSYLTETEADALYAPIGVDTDPWTYVKLASDFVTGSATAVDVTGLAFTPAANKSYEFEAQLRCRTATATVGPRPGLAWPTGATDGVAMVDMPTTATARVLVNGNVNAALLTAVGGLPNTTQSYPAAIYGNITMGASPSGAVRVQLASETAATNVTIKAGSYLKYRELP